MTTLENLTPRETKVLIHLIDNLYAEPGFSDVSPQDLSEICEIDMKYLRGILGSLTKKEVIYIVDKEDLGCEADIVYLCEAWYKYHPEWKDY